MEQRLDGLLGAGERGRVRAGGARARGRRPALHREDRLLAGDAAGDLAEAARVAERLEVEHDQLRALVLLPVLEQVVGRHVRLVADRDERREAEAPLRRLLEQREPERAALRREPIGPGGARAARRSRSATGRRRRCRGSWGRRDGRRARARARAAAPAARGLPRRSPRSPPRSRRARGSRPSSADHARSPAPGARQADHGEVDLLGQLLDRRVRADAGHGSPVRLTGYAAPLNSARDDVPEDDAADCLAPGRRSNHGNARGSEERAQRGDDGEVVALLDVSAVGAPSPRSGRRPRRCPGRARARHRTLHPRTRASWPRSRPSPLRRSARSPPRPRARPAARACACRSRAPADRRRR